MQDDESLVGRSKACPGFWLVYLPLLHAIWEAWRACCSGQNHVTSYKLNLHSTPLILGLSVLLRLVSYSTSRYLSQRMWMKFGTYLTYLSCQRRDSVIK